MSSTVCQAKPESHIALYDFMKGAELEDMLVTRKHAGKKLNYRYRWFTGAHRTNAPHSSGGPA